MNPMWADIDTSEIVIYLASFSIRVPRNRGKTMVYHLLLVQLATTIPPTYPLPPAS